MGCSVTFFAKCQKALAKLYGDRLVSSQGQINELIEAMGEVERLWKALLPVPEKEPADG